MNRKAYDEIAHQHLSVFELAKPLRSDRVLSFNVVLGKGMRAES